MDIDEEKIKNNTVCPDCSGKEMKVGYMFGDGGLHKRSSVFGMDAFRSVCDVAVVVCASCGLMIKFHAKNPEKL